MVAAAILQRSEVLPEHTWNAPSVFPSREAWQTAYQQAADSLSTVERFQGHLGDSPDMLAEFADAFSELYLNIGKLYMYALMTQAVDTSDQEAAGMAGQAGALFGRFAAALAFSDPELLQIGKEKLDGWIAQDSRLALYKQYVDNLFRTQAHVRSGEVEEILGMVSDPFGAAGNTATVLENAELPLQPATTKDGDSVALSQGSINSLLASPDRDLRRSAWENYADGYLAFKNTFANNLSFSVKRDVFFARARRYNSSLEAALFRDNIPTEVFYNLIDTYRRNLPTWHKYWRVRRKALGVETLHPYDIWAPLTTNSPNVSYEQAVDMICEGMKPLGSDYVNTLRQGCLQNRWVDIYPNKGKQQGAFSFGWQGTHPFINMSYDDTLASMSTLAHELGHSMHSYYTWQNQHALYTDYSIFVAEVASNFNQALTRAYLMETQTDKDFQIALIEEAMSNFHRYFFIMPTLARFELELHEREERGEGITADSMNALLVELFSEGYGGEMHIDHDRVGITWAQFPHLYASFYVFQYATGISAAHALAARVQNGGESAAKDYVAFLSAGSSLYPMDALKLAGVDMTTPEAVEQTYAVLAGMVDRLEQLTS